MKRVGAVALSRGFRSALFESGIDRWQEQPLQAFDFGFAVLYVVDMFPSILLFKYYILLGNWKVSNNIFYSEHHPIDAFCIVYSSL